MFGMKKLTAILLLLLTLSSCGREDHVTETSAPVILPEQTESETVAVYTYYIGNKQTKKYHKPTCSYLPDPKNQIQIPQDQINIEYDNYTPCGHCDP